MAHAIEAVQAARSLIAAHGYIGDKRLSTGAANRMAEFATGLTAHALRLIGLQIAVGAGAMPTGDALALLREQAAYFQGMADMADDDAKRAIVEPMLALYEIFLRIIENAAKAR
jgi:hypothetical protein